MLRGVKDIISSERLLCLLLDDSNYKNYQTEYKFHPKRRWRFDVAFPNEKIAIEIEGGHWTNGRHTRGKGFENDCEKYNTATSMGWRVLRFTTNMVHNGSCMDIIDGVMNEI